MKILGIETSCDETAAAVVRADLKIGNWKLEILSNIVSSQVDLHKKYGGVYPELAARAHLENIIPAVKAALNTANCDLKDIDLIAVTVGPGLIGSLLVGVNTAKTLAYSLNKPIFGINHLEGHIYANFIREIKNQKSKIKNPILNSKVFPAICLIVSGGHTSLVLMSGHGQYKVVGQTRDDAAGEAFDKVAQILGFSYPGGPAIEKIAQEFEIKNKKLKIKNPVKLPRPMLDSKDFDFSFAGLKTAVLYLVKQIGSETIKKVRQQIAREFQQAVIDVLIEKTLKAAQKYRVKSICLSGGVSANKELREQFKQKISLFTQSSNRPIIFHCPAMELTTDNAAMIGIAAAFQPKKAWSTWNKIRAKADLRIKNH